MLIREITYEDFNGTTVTEKFHFHMSRREMAEEIEINKLDKKMERLTETSDLREAYELFKYFILATYGQMDAEGRKFYKTDENDKPLRRHFRASPAFDELILEFLGTPESGAHFLEQVVPADLLAEAKAEVAKKENGDPVVGSAVPVVETPEGPKAVPPTPTPAPTWDDYTEDQLLLMGEEEFLALLGSPNPTHWTKPQLTIAMKRASIAKGVEA